MADAKDEYSEESGDFVARARAGNSEAERFYLKSKRREAKHGDEWDKVNLLDVLGKFVPRIVDVMRRNEKLIFCGERYNVVCDMASGYLRIYDNTAKSYVFLDGTIDTKNRAHYKIKQREEM